MTARLGLALALALSLTACSRGKSRSGGGGGGAPPPAGPVVDLDVDTDRNGAVDATADESGEDSWSTTRGAVFYYNIDDDDTNDSEDHKDTLVNTNNDEADLARVILRQYTPAPVGGTVTVTVSPAAAQGSVRIFRKQGSIWTQVYSAGASFTLPIADLDAGDIELGIEATKRIQPSWDGVVLLTVDVQDAVPASIGTDVVRLRCAPFLMATNLWSIEQLHVVNVGSNNQAFRTALSGVCSAAGVTYTEIPGGSYSNDRWVQDSSEPGAVLLPSATSARRRVDHVMQCARWRQVDAWCKNVLWNPDFDWLERFSTNSSSLNYGGNIECVPPHTNAGGTAYPWGRVLIGGGSSYKIGTTITTTRYQTVEYRDYYNALGLQGPYLQISTEWLAVGHVDELVGFIPAPNTARGWVIGIASPNLAKTILQNVQSSGGGTQLVFAGRTSGSWETTVNAILADATLMAWNQEVQQRIDAVRSYLKTNCGLADSDFVEMPVLYEKVSNDNMAAYNPGVQNFMPVNTAGGAIRMLIPDPEGPDWGGGDAWQLDINSKLASLGTTSQPVLPTYVDIFYSYHTLLGEAHCGLNAVRTPPATDWWDD